MNNQAQAVNSRRVAVKNQSTVERVLVVDDDPMFRMMLEKFLHREGFDVLLASSGEAAIMAFQQQPVRLVLMDADMPGMNGFDCCKQLHQMSAPDTPAVLMLTALEDSAMVDRAFAAGAMDYLTKPVNWAVLRNRLHYLSQVRRAHAAQRASEARKDAVFNSVLDAIFTLNAEGIIQEANPSACRMFGCSLAQLMAEYHIGRLLPCLAKLSSEAPLGFSQLDCLQEVSAVRGDGRTFPIEVAISLCQLEEGRLYTLTARDISVRKRTEQELKLAATVLETTSEAVMITDENNRIRSVNPAFTRITGYQADEVLGLSPSILASGRHDYAFYKRMWEQLLSCGHWQGEVWNQRKDGSQFPSLLSVNTVLEAGSPVCHIALFQDISERKAYEENIWHQANHDTLTRLANRHHFENVLRDELMTASAGHSLALLFIDLDHFKMVNDTLGHSYGDCLLQQVARRIQNSVDKQGLVARLGGDEFTVILPHLSKIAVQHVAEKIRHSLVEPFMLEPEKTVCVSASIGVTFYPDDAREFDDLLQCADAAMYDSKQQGRNRVTFFAQKVFAQRAFT
ncbi:MAG: diguanylate cyclase [Marinobacterium sp.]|nr:diguanylate cyclase [Marinobacterium sp.]